MEHGWPRRNARIEPPLRRFDFSWDFVAFVVFIFASFFRLFAAEL
jgi:hypothetical protein